MEIFKFEADFNSWDTISEQINIELKEQGVSVSNIRKIMMALEEHISNIIKYNEASVNVELTMDILKDAAKFIIEDNGKKFNPEEVIDASTDEEVVRKRVGGMGITMVRRLMDETDYTYEEKNIFKMTKYLGEE